MPQSNLVITGFKGLNNTADPISLPPDWQVTADNGYFTDQGVWRSPRPGYSVFDSGFSELYATRDEKELYAVTSAGVVHLVTPGRGSIEIGTAGAGPYKWTEAGNVVFLQSSVGSYAIYPGEHKLAAWGLAHPVSPVCTALPYGSLPAGQYKIAFTYDDGQVESGAGPATSVILGSDGGIRIESIPIQSGRALNVYISYTDGAEMYKATSVFYGDADVLEITEQWPLGIQLRSQHYHPPISADEIEFHDGRIWLSAYDESRGMSGVFPSIELEYHWFELDSPDVLWVPGRVILLSSTPNGMVIGTDREVYAATYSDVGAMYLKRLSTYGVIPGFKDWHQDGRAVFWTTRGLCAALPFENLTEAHISVDPGTTAPGGIIESDGTLYAVVRPDDRGFAENPFNDDVTVVAPTTDPSLVEAIPPTTLA